MMTDEGNNPWERRRKMRFPIQRDLRYKLLEKGSVIATGVGQTIDMASGGMAFTTERKLKAGGLCELSISWPVLLDQTCPMRLIVFGRLLRGEAGGAACTVAKYEFRTQSRALQLVPITRSDSMLQRWADAVHKDEIKAQQAHA